MIEHGAIQHQWVSFHQWGQLIEVGVMEMNRNPENYFAEVEQAAFSPANVVPGISFDPAYNEPPLKISGDADRYEQKRGVDDDYIQPGNLYRLMPPGEQRRLGQNIAGSLKKVPKEIQKKMVEHFSRADKAYGEGVAKGLQ